MEIPGVTTETVTAEELANEAQAAPAPEAVKRTRTKKTDEQKAAEKAEKEAARAAKKAEKEANKKPRQTKADKFIKNLVPAAASGLRAGTGRYLFLEASESATKVSDLIGKEFQVGDKTVKLNAGNIQGMFSRGHVALSDDGENWLKVQTELVSA